MMMGVNDRNTPDSHSAEYQSLSAEKTIGLDTIALQDVLVSAFLNDTEWSDVTGQFNLDIDPHDITHTPGIIVARLNKNTFCPACHGCVLFFGYMF